MPLILTEDHHANGRVDVLTKDYGSAMLYLLWIFESLPRLFIFISRASGLLLFINYISLPRGPRLLLWLRIIAWTDEPTPEIPIPLSYDCHPLFSRSLSNWPRTMAELPAPARQLHVVPRCELQYGRRGDEQHAVLLQRLGHSPLKRHPRPSQHINRLFHNDPQQLDSHAARFLFRFRNIRRRNQHQTRNYYGYAVGCLQQRLNVQRSLWPVWYLGYQSVDGDRLGHGGKQRSFGLWLHVAFLEAAVNIEQLAG